MEGSNFKYFKRNEKLKEMTIKYYDMCEVLAELGYIAKETDDFTDYEAQLKKIRRLAYNIWNEAFYSLGRTNKAADDYCRAHDIDY